MPDKPNAASSSAAPDYDLDDTVAADSAAALKALADPTRSLILDLVLERAATVTELAEALDRPKSSVAYHVDSLVNAGLLKVVRRRRVRAIEERFYGRTGRTIVMGGDDGEKSAAGSMRRNFLTAALHEVGSQTDLAATLRHARIPESQAKDFFERVVELAEEFTKQPRGGESVYGFVAAVYPTDHPVLPTPDAEEAP